MGGGVIDVVSAHRMARHPKGPGSVRGGQAADETEAGGGLRLAAVVSHLPIAMCQS
ncbi:hypothetical protein Ato02nite_019310 [Paractinoplanes toevensis]|uniref:Uncharacterized protein n=1 Tax=Paractinoplanes toevensis TaxID=571911 RepID=A0A919W4I3_9ACTN|nr:hypothetical protein Ato02nite_019310 [Actinoplanes toevensis]